MSETVPFPVSFSPDALAQMRRTLLRRGDENSFVRIGVKGGGCSGFEYVLKLDNTPSPYDLTIVVDGLRIVCDSKSAEFLAGSRVVATGNLMGGGLKFENPNASRSCGCGTSFSPKPQSKPNS